MIKFKRLIALVLAFALVVSYGPVFMDTDAVNGLKLKNTNVTLKVIKKDGVNYSSNHTIKIQKSKGIKILKTTYTSMNKSIAKVSKKGVVTPISAGNTVIIIKVKYKKKGKKISKKFKLDIEVILEDLDNSEIKPNYSTTTEVTATSAETKSTTEVTTTRSEAESTTAVELIATTSIQPTTEVTSTTESPQKSDREILNDIIEHVKMEYYRIKANDIYENELEMIDELKSESGIVWRDGRIVSIDWNDAELYGSISFDGLDELEYLDITSNHADEIDVSNNLNLQRLSCGGEYLRKLILGNNSKLKELNFGRDECEVAMEPVNLSRLTELTYLNCGGAELPELDLSNNTKLERFNGANNSIKVLDLKNNPLLTYVRVSGCKKLEKLNVTKCVNLTELDCRGNNLTQLDVSNNVNLTSLYCHDNKLVQLDLSNNVNLTELYCYSNNLTQLDVSNNINLRYLECYSNNLTQLDVSNNVNLESLSCAYNNLSVIDISNCPKLCEDIDWLNCDSNVKVIR